VSEKIKFMVYPNHIPPYKQPYQFVVAATQENIDVRLGSMGLPGLNQLPKVDQVFLTMFLHGHCLCVEEGLSGVTISIKHKKL